MYRASRKRRPISGWLRISGAVPASANRPCCNTSPSSLTSSADFAFCSIMSTVDSWVAQLLQ